MSRKTKSILTICVGIIAIVLAIVCFSMDIGFYEPNYSYGGDAYTGMQNAAAQAANNVKSLAEIARMGFGSTLLVMGLSLIVTGINTTDANEKEVIEEPKISVDNEILGYKELLDNGTISQEEYDAKKDQLLKQN